MWSSSTARSSLACAALWLAGCQLVLGFEDFESGVGDAGGGMGGAPAGESGTGGRDGGGSSGEGVGGGSGDDAGPPPVAGGDAGPPVSAPCEALDALGRRFDGVDAELLPSDQDEDMVEVRRPDGSCFLIERFEVSVAKYAELLGNAAATSQADDGPCSFKTALSQPGDAACGDSSPEPELPATCVDWCDARHYCRFHGLELCREEFASEALIDPMRSDWYAACSDGGERVYPYGDRYDPTLCSSGDNPASSCPDCAPSDVATGTSCVAASGAQNLSGNAAEWTSACRDSTGASDSCRVRGGSFRSPTAMQLACDDGIDGQARDTRADHIGFRCCFYAE